MLKFEARPEASRLMSMPRRCWRWPSRCVIGVLPVPDPRQGSGEGAAGVLRRAGEEPVRAVGAGDEGDAAAADRARPGGVLPLQRLEHRRRGAVHPRRDLRRRRGDAGRPAAAWMGRWIVVAILLAGVLGGMVWAAHRRAAARPLQRQRDPGQPDARLRGRHGAELPRLRAVEGPAGLQLPADHHLRCAETKIPRLVDGLRTHIGVVIALVAVGGVLGVAVPHLPRLPAAGRRAGAGGGALRRLLVAQRAVDGAAAVGRHGRAGRLRWTWPGRSGSSRRTCRPATASPRSSSPTSGGCTRWARLLGAC